MRGRLHEVHLMWSVISTTVMFVPIIVSTFSWNEEGRPRYDQIFSF